MASSDGRAPRPLVLPPRTIPVSEPELARLPLFEGISLEELMLMSGCLSLSRRDFDESQTIILAEQRVSLVGAIVEGSVQMVTQDIDGNESIFACLYPGELVGESFACGPTRTSRVTFRAASQSSLLFLDFSRINRTCSRSCRFHQRLASNMVSMLCQKNVLLMQRLEVVSQRTLRQKVLTYLSIEAARQGKSKGEVISVPLTRAQFAAYLGANRSALSRELSLMQREGSIAIEGCGFRLR